MPPGRLTRARHTAWPFELLAVVLVGLVVATLRGSAALPRAGSAWAGSAVIPAAVDVPASAIRCADPALSCPVARSVAGSTGTASGTVPATSAPAAPSLKLLQMNLCDSGLALDCYTGGRAVTEAAGKIAAYRPDVVTLNEVCRADVLDTLLTAMARAHPGAYVVAAFEAAWSPVRHTEFPCTNGQPFGDGVIVATAGAGPGVSARPVVGGGTYPESIQFLPDDEDRGWVCVAAGGRFAACTSHLVANHADLAARQCGALMNDDVPALAATTRDGGTSHAAEAGSHGAAILVGGDLNLTDAAAQNCAPAGYRRASDPGNGPYQHVLVCGLAVGGAVDLGMDRTTDHPALLVTLRPATP